MAGGTLFTLLDDLASLLDDISAMTKVAAKKTAGVVGDDLALNANQVQGMASARELPVVLAVAKGSLVNKVILVPVALLLSVFLPVLITPLLMLGGAYLCFEGAEKFLHARAHKEEHGPRVQPPEAPDEKAKIRGAIRTDFILSAEIIVIALGTIDPNTAIPQRALVLSAIALGMTVGVYGLVALIVKLDDMGLALVARKGAGAGLGRGLLWLAPRLMKFLSVAGTIAMFMVGGEILLHGIPHFHAPEGLLGMGAGLLAGVVVGFVLAFLFLGAKRLAGGSKDKAHA